MLITNSPVWLEIIISNGNRTEWSPIQYVTIRVITKSDDGAAGVRFVYHEVLLPINHIKITISEKRKVAKLCDNGNFTFNN